ncbi:6-carboxytetrahydropterin synthase QueD, partial [bacterium]|nr:6-carboxytetrahydropterin synthase QueD [bacterium]
KRSIEDILDHHLINEVIEQPTAENICYWMFDTLVQRYGDSLVQITLWETPECSVSLTNKLYK